MRDSFSEARETGAPLPTTLEDALAEILVLKRQLMTEREWLAKAVGLRAQDNRAAAGQIKALKNELEEYKEALRTVLDSGTVSEELMQRYFGLY
jgi:hypothetical protein